MHKKNFELWTLNFPGQIATCTRGLYRMNIIVSDLPDLETALRDLLLVPRTKHHLGSSSTQRFLCPLNSCLLSSPNGMTEPRTYNRWLRVHLGGEERSIFASEQPVHAASRPAFGNTCIT